jgi:hypothetical protein
LPDCDVGWWHGPDVDLTFQVQSFSGVLRYGERRSEPQGRDAEGLEEFSR